MRPGSSGAASGMPFWACPLRTMTSPPRPCRRRPSGSLPPTPVSRPACATAPSPSCWRGSLWRSPPTGWTGFTPTPATQMGSPSPAACARMPPGGTLPSTPWPTPPARGCRTSSGGRRTWPRGPSAQWAGRRPAFTRTPCASSGPCGLLPCWTSPWRRRPTRPPWPAPRCWRPSRRSGCSANWANSSAAKPPGGCCGPIPGAGGGGAGDPPHGGV